jgi:hypothetical protein
MEIIIGLVILGGVAWFFFMRNDKKSDEVASNNITAPYKVPEPAATTKIPLVVDVIPAGTEASIVAPATKAKASAKPKAPAKTAAKAPAKPKAPAKTAAKAPAKPKSPAKPKITVAK